ncbi:protoporphyrinogen oxidase [Streptomyces sp. RKND-216]|uniref:protoporphyrinogen oxidase n=1 Tax=Streptomyces sp. RKND-216 TaxID=2562581 RepID=UPI00109DB857|nr:protoporphyrinogen oxidase [Streptomyces sp. RKND-216]THA23904.1 protoporphyrinogen oxidase [Streptomyces sp. RKND-216]
MHVIVIGGGISGLSAAHRLLAGGATVTLLEGSGRFGGKLRTGDLAGALRVDLGAESMLARRPEGVDLARSAGLDDALEPPTTARAAVWTRGALRPMPTGHLMGVPPDPAVLGDVLSPDGLARVAEDAVLPRTEVGEDIAVGAYVAARVGREVVDRMVEPLLGGVYAGDPYRLSMRAAVPALYEIARTERSLLAGVRAYQERAMAGRAAARAPEPVFMGIDGGVGRLAIAVADACRRAGADLRTRAAVRRVRVAADSGAASAPASGEGRWRVELDAGGTLSADAVIVATPAPAAARLLGDAAPAAAAELDAVEYASMALITMAFRRSDLPAVPPGSGFLVPPVDGRGIKAATFSANKWGWTAAQDPGLFVLRTSVGRHGEDDWLRRDDADLAALSRRDLADAVGLTAAPVDTVVTRWENGLPQYPVGHLERVARVHRDLAALPGLAVCGAAYGGVGIPACVADGRRAADRTLGTGPAARGGE